MKRVPLPMDVLEHNGVIYSTADFVSPSAIFVANPCVHVYKPVHRDWELVPCPHLEAPPSLVDAATAYPWGGCSSIIIGVVAYGLRAHNRGRVVILHDSARRCMKNMETCSSECRLVYCFGLWDLDSGLHVP